MPATFIVTNLADAGAGSLRDAIALADADPTDHDTITFGVMGTIYLNDSLVPNTAMDIVGPGADLLTIRPAAGTPDFRMMRIRNDIPHDHEPIHDEHTDDPILISGLTFSGGRADHGTAIDGHGSVIVVDCTFTGNTQTDPADGGILYNIIGGRMDVINCVITGNSGQRGVVYNEGSGTLTVTGCTITNNTTKLGGGIYSGGGTVFVTDTVVSGNRATGFSSGSLAGGGVYNLGTMTISNSIIRDNVADDMGPYTRSGRGGGIYNEGDLTITGSDIGANTAGQAGGGIWNADDLIVTNCTIQDNRVTDFWSYGGGIANEIMAAYPGPQLLHMGNLTISNSLVTRNTAGFDGGGIWNQAVLTVDACTISENSTSTARWFGGGIYNSLSLNFPTTSGIAVITNSTIANNFAAAAGGGIACENGASLTLVNSTVSGNRSKKGAGIYLELENYAGNVQIRNSTIASNVAPSDPYNPGQGGGLFIERSGGSAGQVVIANSTIARNSAAAGGGGIRTAVSYYGLPIDVRLDNTIVAANTGSRGDIDGLGGSTLNPASSYNLIGNGSFTNLVNGVNGNIVGTTASPIDPLLGPLQNNGGPTQTMALLAGSRAINAGHYAYAPAGDQRGLPRIAGPAVDIGAYELQGAPMPTLNIADVSVTEGHSGTHTALFTVTLSAAATQPVTVNYTTANGTAAAADYAATSGTLIFNPGETSKTITVVVNGDVANEPNETFLVYLFSPVNATITDNRGIGTILDDDPLPTLSITDVAVTEGDSGTLTALFTVTLSAASSQNVTFNFATADGTATTADYTRIWNTVGTIAAGSTTATIAVSITGDWLDEPNQTFFVNLSNAVNATIADGQAVGTILDNDPLPTMSINDVSITEGHAGTKYAQFTVSLFRGSDNTVSVNYATANGTATAPGDYTAASGTLTFGPGWTAQTVYVVIQGEGVVEPNETFFVNLSNAVNATIADAQGQGTIVNDDPNLSINDVTVTEGDTGTVNAVFTVTLSSPSAQNVTVNYTTANGSATTADYTATSGTLTILAGSTTGTITVSVQADLLDEANETFYVNLSSAVNAWINDGQGVCTIVDNDPPPTVSIDDVAATEGNTGTKVFTFQVSLSAASGRSVSVYYATANGTAQYLAPADYTAASGWLTFNPGQTTKMISITVVGDTVTEPDETFFVNLMSASNATLADAQGQGTILNDDGGGAAASSLGSSSTSQSNGGSSTSTALLAAPATQSTPTYLAERLMAAGTSQSPTGNAGTTPDKKSVEWESPFTTARGRVSSTEQQADLWNWYGGAGL